MVHEAATVFDSRARGSRVDGVGACRLYAAEQRHSTDNQYTYRFGDCFRGSLGVLIINGYCHTYAARFTNIA